MTMKAQELLDLVSTLQTGDVLHIPAPKPAPKQPWAGTGSRLYVPNPDGSRTPISGETFIVTYSENNRYLIDPDDWHLLPLKKLTYNWGKLSDDDDGSSLVSVLLND